MRAYIAPEKLNRFNPNIPDKYLGKELSVKNVQLIKEHYFIASGNVSTYNPFGKK